MGREVELRDVSTALDDVEYPVTRSTAAEALSDVTVVLADGTADLGELISDTSDGTFESADDIETPLHSVLPRRSVGDTSRKGTHRTTPAGDLTAGNSRPRGVHPPYPTDRF